MNIVVLSCFLIENLCKLLYYRSNRSKSMNIVVLSCFLSKAGGQVQPIAAGAGRCRSYYPDADVPNRCGPIARTLMPPSCGANSIARSRMRICQGGVNPIGGAINKNFGLLSQFHMRTHALCTLCTLCKNVVFEDLKEHDDGQRLKSL